MELSKAIIDAFKISQKNPGYVLCGSIALILKGVIPRRNVHDIDFVVERDKVDLEDLKNKSYKRAINNDEYFCFFIEEDGMQHDLFVFKDDREISRNDLVIPTQDEEDILEMKMTYSRSKDKFDLSCAEVEAMQRNYVFDFIYVLSILKILDSSKEEDYSVIVRMSEFRDGLDSKRKSS